MIVSKETANHYVWGNNCDGWPLVERSDLSIKQERMPQGTMETRHYHQKSRQFFFVLRGTLKMEIEGEWFEMKEGQGIEVSPTKLHQAVNDSNEDVEFIVISQPTTKGDRIEE
ncbi:cupin domain-containing protein [Paenibacillus beijingensis]|uniref:Cupin n=1 Tax=Paenibacillus beijingensis TaxID=1126833 RepID=A0A0D5NQ01_9BACL|nr:cupin domain-containing protein [Paenibacillus beijingensis]AJY77008.1 cupin [Paenibacillus beijingensis]